MAFLKKNPRKFYTIFLDNNVCKIYFRELNSRRAVLEEGSKNIYIKNREYLDEINEFIKDKENSYICLLQTSLQQGLVGELGVDVSENIIQNIDKDVISYANLKDIEYIKGYLKFKIDEFISPFKILYFLYKNVEITSTSLLMLKFGSSMAVMVVNKNGILDATMIDLKEIYILFYNEGHILDNEELFFEALKQYIANFYKDNNDFIDKIYVYSNEGLGVEMGYYIFTKIFIRTEVPMLNLMDFVNKINIKEKF